jgi:hypothetical protein
MPTSRRRRPSEETGAAAERPLTGRPLAERRGRDVESSKYFNSILG